MTLETKRARLRVAALSLLTAVCALAVLALVLEPAGGGAHSARSAPRTGCAPRSEASGLAARSGASRAGRMAPASTAAPASLCPGTRVPANGAASPVSSGEPSADGDAEGDAAGADSESASDSTERAEVVYVSRARLVELVSLGLSDAEPVARLDALRLVRANQIPEVASQVEQVALSDAEPVVRRVAAQVIALGDLDEGRPVLERLAADADLGVRAHAAFGLARRGDPRGNALLLECLACARRDSSQLAAGIERAIAIIQED